MYPSSDVSGENENQSTDRADDRAQSRNENGSVIINDRHYDDANTTNDDAIAAARRSILESLRRDGRFLTRVDDPEDEDNDDDDHDELLVHRFEDGFDVDLEETDLPRRRDHHSAVSAPTAFQLFPMMLPNYFTNSTVHPLFGLNLKRKLLNLAIREIAKEMEKGTRHSRDVNSLRTTLQLYRQLRRVT